MRLPVHHVSLLHLALIALSVSGCGAPSPTRDPAPPLPLAAPPPPAPLAPTPAPIIAPEPDTDTGANVPAPLAEEAGKFGLKMLGDTWSWKAISQRETRFDWSGRPASNDREVLYSFWMPTIDAPAAKLLPQIVASAAANLSDREPCAPFDQPAEIVKILGVERVITVCFEPMAFYVKEFHRGVLHGIVNKGALTRAVAFSNDRAAVIPLAKLIGARGVSSKSGPR
ncbi:MAG: hypothetical protein ABJE95_07120 [Byssovorax sp.]